MLARLEGMRDDNSIFLPNVIVSDPLTGMTHKINLLRIDPFGNLQIINVILRDLYCVKRLNQTLKKDKFPHTLFVYEKGKSKVKYHTHLFLENKNLKYDSIEALEFLFNTKIRKKRKCFSNWKKINIERVFSVKGALSYCNKETNSSNYSIDYQTSNLIHQYAN